MNPRRSTTILAPKKNATHESRTDLRLEYLKMLVSKSEQTATAFNSSTGRLFLYAVLFFVFAHFETTDLTLFGAKVNIPGQWIVAVAPLVVTFYYVRITTLYLLQAAYQTQIEITSPEITDSSGKSPFDADKISDATLWILPPPRTASLAHRTASAAPVVAAALAILVIPPCLVGYFIWMMWTAPALALWPRVAVTALCGVFGATTLVQFIYQGILQ